MVLGSTLATNELPSQRSPEMLTSAPQSEQIIAWNEGFYENASYDEGVLALALCAVIPITVFASDNSYKVTYDGGSFADLKSGSSLKMYIDSDNMLFVRDGKDVGVVLASSVTEISYGQDVHRRVGAAIAVGVFTLGLGALMALSKSKKHFVGLTWAGIDHKGGLAMQCDKNEYRGILAGIEGITGKKAIDSDTMTVKN